EVNEIRTAVGLPLHEHGSPGQTGAEAAEKDRIAALDPAFPVRLVQSQRDTGRRGVAIAIQIVEDLVRIDAEVLDRRVDDPKIGLVEDDQIDVRQTETRAFEYFP